MCARHGLQRSDLQDHAEILGLDVGTIDDDAAHVEQVQTTLFFSSMHQMRCDAILDRLLLRPQGEL